MLIPPRRRRKGKKTEGTQTATSHGSNTKRPGGRPLKRTSELKPPRIVQRQQEKFLHQKLMAEMADSRQPEQLSHLEALPVELIQQIFFYSLEVNMPRATPHIAKVLSNSSIYSALILFAYFEHDNANPVEEQLFLPAKYREISLEDKIRLQNGILGCRWCSLDLFKSSMRILSLLQITQAWYREKTAQDELNLPEECIRNPRIRLRMNQALRPLAPLPPSPANLEELEKRFLAKAPFPANGQAHLMLFREFDLRSQRSTDTRIIGPTGDGNYLPRIIQWRNIVPSKTHFYKELHCGITTLATRVLPDHILEGKPSWTRPKLELLMLLRQGARFLVDQKKPECSADALYEGMTSAIKSHDSNALLVLLELHFICMENGEQWTPGPSRLYALTMPFTSPIPLRLFHLACAQECPISSSLLSLLIREGIDSIPLDDITLTAWAVRNKGDDVARFLLQHMEGSHDYGQARDEPRLFMNGNLVRPSLRGLPFPKMTFTRQIGYLTQYDGYAILP